MTKPSRRLRVLMLLDNPTDQGGAERFALGLAAQLPRDRIEPWVCATRAATPEAVEQLEAAAVPLVVLGRRRRADAHRLAGLVSLLRRERFDVIHAHMFGSNAWGAVLGRLCRLPVVIAHEHNWSFAGSPARRLVDRHVIARLATRFVTVSDAARHRMIELERIDPGKIVVLPTAYVPHRVAGAGAGDLRAELGLGPRARIVVVAASLRPEKALEVLVAAHDRLARDCADVHLVIAGEGRCRPALERQIAGLGHGSSVHLLGARHDVGALLGAADVGALSSDWEGMPLFLLECMTVGVPVTATSVGGIPELVEHDRTGLLVPPRDPAALAGAISALLEDPARSRRLAAAAATRVQDLTIEAVALRFAEFYECLVAAKRTAL
ncbi:MAG TPA: glycosyltransferase [Solirubrobacteraceae bacterium]|jgi:glycosyltransferase involved in cell wall biosynthesis|nr:glycosyltransferase [Solirubrobacteraceae bacterium]